MIDTEAIRKLADAATKGPWTEKTYRRVIAGLATNTGNHAADAAFIREARELVPDLSERWAKAVKERDYYADKSDILSAELDERDRLDEITAGEEQAPHEDPKRLRQQLAEAHADCARYATERDAARAVVEAAKVWRAQFEKPTDKMFPRQGALIAAVDALDTDEVTR